MPGNSTFQYLQQIQHDRDSFNVYIKGVFMASLTHFKWYKVATCQVDGVAFPANCVIQPYSTVSSSFTATGVSPVFTQLHKEVLTSRAARMAARKV